MGKILEAFASEELRVFPITERRTPYHQHLWEEVEKLHDKLAAKLNEEEKEILEHLVDALFAENSCDVQSKFIRGYRLGVLMTMEVFMGQEAFLGDDK